MRQGEGEGGGRTREEGWWEMHPTTWCNIDAESGGRDP